MEFTSLLDCIGALVKKYHQSNSLRVLLVRSNISHNLFFKDQSHALRFANYLEQILDSAFSAYTTEQKFHQIVLLCVHLDDNKLILTCTDGGKKIFWRSGSKRLILRDTNQSIHKFADNHHVGKTVRRIFAADQLVYTRDFLK